jgi:two-component system sensor histidine kinase DesK
VSSGNDGSDQTRVELWEWPEFVGIRYWGRERRSARAFGSVWVAVLVPDVVRAIGHGRPVVLTVLLALLYACGYLGVWWLFPGRSRRLRVVWVGLTFATGVGFVLVVGATTSLGVLSFALIAAIVLLPLVWAWSVALLTVGTAALVSWLTLRALSSEVLILALVGSIALSTTRMARLISKLQAARAEIRELAVAGERARLARDLHDVLGHSLTTITVKTALARRLLESAAPVDRALAELRDTEELSRRALADIRATVAGQRRVSLAAELVSARAALRAAGIDADLPHAVDDVAAPLHEPLAYVLREGVTNVVRHSGASRCTVRLGPSWLEVRDNGSAAADSSTELGAVEGGAGNGLAGLSERMAAVHGTIRAGPLPTGGYRLRAEAPA